MEWIAFLYSNNEPLVRKILYINARSSFVYNSEQEETVKMSSSWRLVKLWCSQTLTTAQQ